MKQGYGTISLILKHIKYEKHQWVIGVDLRMVNFSSGNKMVTQNIRAFMSLGQHWITRNWHVKNVSL